MAAHVDAAERRRLQLRLALFFVALAVPAGLLLFKALDQLKWEALRQTQLAAEALTLGIDERLDALMRAQDARAFADFAFLTLVGDPVAGFLQRSSLSAFPVDAALPGLIGWFQIDAAGRLSTPLLPMAGTDATSYGIGPSELAGRQQLEQRLGAILGRNALVDRARTEPEPVAEPMPDRLSEPLPKSATTDLDQPTEQLAAPASPEPGPAVTTQSQAIFERLSPAGIGSLSSAPSQIDSKSDAVSVRDALDEAAAGSQAAPSSEPIVSNQRAKLARSPRREQAARVDAEGGDALLASPRPVIRTFESELDPFRFSLLDSGHFVLFRWAWRDGARYVQGALIEPEAFLSALIEDAFRTSVLHGAVNLHVTWGDRSLTTFGAPSQRYDLSGRGTLPSGTIVYRGRLAEPFGALRLVFDAARLQTPPAATLVVWLGLSLALVLIAGSWGLYRLGLRQLGLVRQQQDFVAAVSHELKTPLTSIRMYSEMLREGWVTDDKRERYYRYIHDEAERLSRLVANVLQLARMSRDDLRLEPRPVAVSALIEQASPALLSQSRQAGFALLIDCAGDAVVDADPDALTQVLINLVDNAVKFSVKARRKQVEIVCADAADGCIWIGVRDHGPGIPKTERRRVFELFRRLENESTRDTKGTGIGLALVERLMRAMHGRVELIGHEPGVEVRLWLPRHDETLAKAPGI